MTVKDDFASIADVLKAEIGKIAGQGLEQTALLKKKWPEIVGPTIAKHSTVLYVKEQQVCVGVTNSTWLNELNLMKDKILAALSARDDCPSMTSLKFKIVIS